MRRPDAAARGCMPMMLNLTYFSPKIEKRASLIDGRGLFATAAITKGEVVVVKGGYILTRGQRDLIGEELGPSEIQITEDLFIGPTTLAEREGGMMHLNHSCEPNLGLQGQIVFVAMRDTAALDDSPPICGAANDQFYEREAHCHT